MDVALRCVVLFVALYWMCCGVGKLCALRCVGLCRIELSCVVLRYADCETIRYIWGEGDGSSLKVYNTDRCGKIGGK